MQRFFMAKKYDIDIDSYIGGWECNKRAIKNLISKAGGNDVHVRVNSLGGDLDTAVDIAAQFEAHGNIVCDLYSFNASAATVLTLGAKSVRMHENAMYLIHKALFWVDEFGYMNEDDLDSLIQKLEQKKDNSAIVTLNAAQMYAKKSGKPIKDILNLMKDEKWLNAQTAKEWGFVDEIFSGSIPSKKIENIVEMLNMAELPIPENLTAQTDEPGDDESRRSFIAEVVAGVKSIFSNPNKPIDNMKKVILNVALLAAILNVKEIEAQDDKVEFTADNVTAIENSLSVKDTEIENLKNSLSEKETEITNLKTEIANKDAAPGDKTKGVKKETDEIVDDESGEKFDNSFVESAKALYDALP